MSPTAAPGSQPVAGGFEKDEKIYLYNQIVAKTPIFNFLGAEWNRKLRNAFAFVNWSFFPTRLGLSAKSSTSLGELGQWRADAPNVRCSSVVTAGSWCLSGLAKTASIRTCW